MQMFTKQLEKNNGIETDYVKLLYYDFATDHNEIYRSYNHPRLCTIIEGEKKVAINEGSPILYDDKSMILLPPNSSVDMEIKQKTKALVLEFSDDLIDTVVNKASVELNDEVKYDKHQLIHRELGDLNMSLKQIMNSIKADDPRKEFLIDLYVQDMMYRLISQDELKNIIVSQGNQLIRSAVQMMYDGLPLQMIAKQLMVSPSNLSHQFRNTFNLTPTQYYNSLKMKRAKELLIRENVTEVAYDLGYDNISYFIRLFKSYYGVTPKQYMKQLKDSVANLNAKKT